MLLYDRWVKNKGTTLALYNSRPISSTSRILGKWAVFSAVAAFRFSRVIIVNSVAFSK